MEAKYQGNGADRRERKPPATTRCCREHMIDEASALSGLSPLTDHVRGRDPTAVPVALHACHKSDREGRRDHRDASNVPRERRRGAEHVPAPVECPRRDERLFGVDLDLRLKSGA